ncbi:hypothetical protein [Luteibacter sp. W1I16]|uniref:hypothetical protein n=1 Tax=Luteibacter sp. W1I16 TaxID=3373922 RepID=UPI003D20CBE7
MIDAYLEANGLSVMPAHDVDNLAMAMSLIVSTRSIALLPEYAKDFFPRVGDQPFSLSGQRPSAVSADTRPAWHAPLTRCTPTNFNPRPSWHVTC